MPGLELLLRPDLGKKAYRLRCRFVIGAYPSARMLEKAKYHAADLFVADMAKQGWQYVSRHGFTLKGPFPATVTIELPNVGQQERWHVPSKELLPAVQAGYRARTGVDGGYAQPVPLLTDTDAWEFELAGVFTHATIMTEVPDAHEEES